MPEVHVPFLKGLHEETEKRLLPQGYMTRAENVRFKKEGRVVSRNGYVFIEGASESDDIAAVGYERDRTLHFSGRGLLPSQWWQRKPDGTFTDPVYASAISSLETPKRTVATPTIRFSALASDIATVGSHIFVVYNDSDTPGHTQGGLFFSVYERQTMQIVDSGVIVQYGEAASSYFNPKCIVVGTSIAVFYVLDDALLMYVYDPSTLTGADVTLSPTLTWASPVTGHHTSFDVCLFDADEVAVCTEFIVTGTSTGVALYRIALDGTLALAFADTSYGSDPKQVGVAPGSAGQFGIACVTNGNMKWGLFSSTGTVLTAVSDIDSSGDALGAPCVRNDFGNAITWGRQGSPSGQMGIWNPTSINPPKYIPALWPVCKPFLSSDLSVFVWAADLTHVHADDPDGQAGGFATYRLLDIGNVNVFDPDAGETISDAVCAQEQALAANFYYGEHYEQRRNVIALAETDENGQAIATCIAALPVLVGAARTSGRVDFVEFRSGDYLDKLFGAKLNGQLFISGSRLREFDGSQLYESGLFQGPREFTAEQVGGGVTIPGTVQYCCLWKWIDAGGRVHRSQVSDAVSVDGIGEGSGFEITVAPPPFSDRRANGSVTIYLGSTGRCPTRACFTC